MSSYNSGFEEFDITEIRALPGDTVKLVYDLVSGKYHIYKIKTIKYVINGLTGNYVLYINEQGQDFRHIQGVNHIECLTKSHKTLE